MYPPRPIFCAFEWWGPYLKGDPPLYHHCTLPPNHDGDHLNEDCHPRCLSRFHKKESPMTRTSTTPRWAIVRYPQGKSGPGTIVSLYSNRGHALSRVKGLTNNNKNGLNEAYIVRAANETDVLGATVA